MVGIYSKASQRDPGALSQMSTKTAHIPYRPAKQLETTKMQRKLVETLTLVDKALASPAYYFYQWGLRMRERCAGQALASAISSGLLLRTLMTEALRMGVGCWQGFQGQNSVGQVV